MGGGGGGGTVGDSISGGGTRHLFLLTLYNFRNIGGRPPCSAFPVASGSTPEPVNGERWA